MVTLFVVLLLGVCVVACILSHWHSQDAEIKHDVNEMLERSMKRNTICIEVDGKRIMLREDFMQKEWNKVDENGIPVRGQYESATHFVNRVKKYRENMKNKKLENGK